MISHLTAAAAAIAAAAAAAAAAVWPQTPTCTQVCCQAAEALQEDSASGTLAIPSARAQFCSNVAGAFFLATLHAGSPLTAAVGFLAAALSRKGPVLETLSELGKLKENAPINKTFNDLYKNKIELACAYETQPPGACSHSIHLFTPLALSLAALTSLFVGCIMALWVVPLAAPALVWSAAVPSWLPTWLTAQRALGMLLGVAVGFLADLYCYQHILITDK